VGAISVSCRYFYKDGHCANGSVSGERCVGADSCRIVSGNAAVETTVPARNAGSGGTCQYDMGYGVYCKKYGRFYCAGKENCGNAGDFMRSFDTHRKKRDGNFHGRKL
jgi:hypothetical protein